jgi:archaetidylinositol phosphate synthase
MSDKAISQGGQSHTRVNDTVIACIEKKALLWMAARMPAWVTPDVLTAVGLFASVLIFASYALTYYNKNFLWLASLGFIINWFGDSLDGTLARYRKIERPRYGFYVDHIIDAVSEVLVFVGLGLSPYLRFDLALIALVSYLLASIYVYLTTYVAGVFRISYGGLSPTEMRLIAIGTNIAVFFTGNPSIQIPAVGPLASLPAGLLAITLFDLVIAVLTLIILGLFVASSITTGMQLSREDRIAARDRRQEARTRRIEQRKAQRAQGQAQRAQRTKAKIGHRTMKGD